MPAVTVKAASTAIAVALAVTACGDRGGEGQAGVVAPTTTVSGLPAAPITAPASGRPPGMSCATPEDGGSPFFVTASDGITIGGLVLGEGPVAVVLAHELGTDLCPWLPVGRRLRDEGYRVALFDGRGHGSSGTPPVESAYRRDLDLRAVVADLRARGVEQVVLVGGSLGATIVTVTAPDLDPPPAGVVNVSGGLGFRTFLPVEIADHLTMPLLFLAGESDGLAPEGAQQVADAAASDDKTVVILPGSGHASELFEHSTAEQSFSALLDFVARVTGG